MYKIFRENNQSLPGDEEIMKTQKPSIKIILQPLSTENQELSLPKLECSQLILQPNMVIESLKKYLKKKFEDKVDSSNYEVSLSYKNIEMLDHYTIKDIERIYSFTGEKTIFYYAKRPNLSSDLKVSPKLEKDDFKNVNKNSNNKSNNKACTRDIPDKKKEEENIKDNRDVINENVNLGSVSNGNDIGMNIDFN